jgi:dihydroflavonol-4-reductase
MIAVVTGAAGHLGAALVRELLGRGQHVRALVFRDTRALDELDIDLVRGDILDRSSLRRAFAGADVVHHLAAQITSPAGGGGRVRDVNVLGTRNVVAACLDSGVGRLVHVGSAHALARTPGGQVIDEATLLADEVGTCSEYEETKAGADREVIAGMACGLDALIGLPTAVYGPHDYKPSPFGSALLAIYHRRLPALVAGAYDWVDSRDVAVGLAAMADAGGSGQRYVLSGHHLSVADLARLVRDVTGRRVTTRECPAWLGLAAAPVFEACGRLTGRRPLFDREAVRILQSACRYSSAKAERELGYRARPPRETVRDTFAWFEAAGCLG